MKELKKRKILLIAAVMGVLLFLGWLIFLIWFLPGVEKELSPSKKDQKAEAIEQGKSDQYFADLEKKFAFEHPWYDKLPLSTDKYFLFYNPTNDTFGIDLYLDPKSSASEINGVKKEVLDYLSLIGVRVSGAKFSWGFIKNPNPEPL